MSQEIDLKQIERKTYMAFHQDGIWDLFVGLAMLSAGVDVIFFDGSGGSIIVLVGAMGVVPMVKKAFTLPRLGYVKFSPQREDQQKRNMSLLVLLLTVTAAIGGVVSMAYTGEAGWQRWVRGLEAIPFGIVLASVAAAFGLLWRIRRCLIYAVLTVAIFAVGHLYHLRIFVHLGILGAILSVVGMTLLIGFIRKYPRRPREVNHGV